MDSPPDRLIIVGIDGSEQARYAALWAVDEALRRPATLRLTYVIRNDLTGTLAADEYRNALDSAKEALARVRDAIVRRNPSVPVETSIAQGSPAAVLLAESPDADMICVGSSGIGRMGRALLGSTAATLAEKAACSVAVVRQPEGAAEHRQAVRWIIMPVGSRTGTHAEVVAAAIAEARLRSLPMLAVGTRDPGVADTPTDQLDLIVSGWQQQHPDVHIYPVSCETSLAEFLRDHPDIGGLAVVDAGHSRDVASIIGGVAHADRAELAVLVSRENTHAATRVSSAIPS